jgi:hypothetical protein
MLSVFVDEDSFIGAQGEGHDGEGVRSANICLDLWRRRCIKMLFILLYVSGY